MTDDETVNNRVFLRGRLAAAPEIKLLPSGDEMVVFRLTVDRPPGEKVRVDSVDCTSTAARVRRSLGKAAVGDVFEVNGSLRRRFWRGPAGLASRYAVEVDTARNVERRGSTTAGRAGAGRAGGGARDRTRASA